MTDVKLLVWCQREELGKDLNDWLFWARVCFPAHGCPRGLWLWSVWWAPTLLLRPDLNLEHPSINQPSCPVLWCALPWTISSDSFFGRGWSWNTFVSFKWEILQFKFSDSPCYNDFKCLHCLINIEESSGIFGPEQLSHQQSLQGKEGWSFN